MSQSNPTNPATKIRAVGASLFIAALVLYAATLSRVFFPGDSARLVAEHLGVATFPAMTHSLWGWCVSALALVSGSQVALVLNAFSALCGAGSVWLMFALMLRLRFERAREDASQRAPIAGAQVVSAVVAALAMATCLPVWIVSTRAHPLSLDLLLSLLTVYLLVRFDETKKPALLNASVLLYGLALTEFPSLFPLVIFYGMLLLMVLLRSGGLRAAVLIRLAALLLLGLAPYFIAAWLYLREPAYEWRAFEGYFQVLWYIWLEQYLTLSRSLPQVGWLTVGMVSVVPWLIVIGPRLSADAPSRPPTFGAVVLNALLSALALALLFNFTLSPWYMTRGQPLMVLPYAFIAMWSGSLAGYWYHHLTRRSRAPNPSRIVGARVYVAAILLYVGLTAVRNLPVANGRVGAFAARFAENVVDDLHGRSWLLTAGLLDDNVALAAWQRGVRVHLLNVRQAGADAYGRYVASLFENPRYKSLARVGLGPLMSEWLKQDPAVSTQLAAVSLPDIWLEAGLVPRPTRILYIGEQPTQAVDVAQLTAEFDAFWNDYGAQAKAQPRQHPLVSGFNRQIVMHLAKMANNLGVYLEDRERSDLAIAYYRQAREMDPQNLSALINLHSLTGREQMPEHADLEKELIEIVNKSPGRFFLWSLSYYNGYVRLPESYAKRGWAWAMSGKARLAETDMQKAMALGGENAGIQLAMANLYFTQEKTDQSAETYLDILSSNPTNMPALLGMARVSTRRGDFDGARGYLRRLRELDAPANVLGLEEAVVDAMSGNPRAAAARLSEVVKAEPDNMLAWASLALVAVQANDEALLQPAMDKLQSAKTVHPSIRLALAQLALNKGNTAAARKQLEEVLRVRPNQPQALEQLLRIVVGEGDRDKAEVLVEHLIGADPRNGFGNYILGSLQLYREQYSLAESSFRVSLETRRTPDTMNDLAWLLRHRGADVEALALIKEALELDPKNGSAWDTYGVILMNKGNLVEAETALQRALSYKPDSASINLNMALLYEKKGLAAEAMRLSESLMARPTELSREELDALRDLVKRLRTQV